MRTAVSAAIDHALAGIQASEKQAPPVPTVLRAQARLAARNQVGLETVMRRYFAGYALLNDFVVEEAQKGEPVRRG